MKKIVFAILAIVVIAALILVFPVSKENSRETESYLRIHIRANSNSDADQELKYKVKQAVVGYGKAEKKQVIAMVTSILKLKAPPKPDDTADALAIAVCHGNCGGSLLAQYYNN